MNRRRRAAHSCGLTAALAVGLLLCSRAAGAQSVRDVVREHVAGELEPERPKDDHEERAKPKPKSDRQPDSRNPPGPRRDERDERDEADIVLSTEAPKDAGPVLPQRILGNDLRIDLQVGGGYRGWVPQPYPHVDTHAGSYYVWNFEVKAKIFRFLNLRRGYYESNGLAGPRTDEAAVAAQVGSYVPKAAWLLGVLGFPLFKIWEPIIRYESRAYHTEANPERPVCVVTDAVADDLSQCRRSRAPLRMLSGFETLVLGVRYDKSKDPSATVSTREEKMPPITFGIGLMSYRKAYQVTINENTLDDYLFDGRFRGAGLAFGTEIGGGPDRLHFNVDAQVGLGEVKLTDDLTLNSLAPEDWLMGYVQGNVTVGYHWPVWRGAPTLMLVPQLTGGGACFFFFKTEQKRGEQSDAATANWDFLWSVQASLVLSL